MRFRRAETLLIVLLGLFLLQRSKTSSPSFSALPWSNRGQPLNKYGKAVHTSAIDNEANHDVVTPEDKQIIAQISEAGRDGNWPKAKAVYEQSGSRLVSVYNAAMSVAMRCGEYSEGLQIYAALQSACVRKTGPTYSVAIKLLSRTNQKDAIQELWAEAQECDVMDKLLITTMIDVAAQEGDTYEAARLLDVMRSRNIEPDIAAWGSAMNACKNKLHAKGAMVFLAKMKEQGLIPNDVVYRTAMLAHVGASLAKVMDLAKVALLQANGLASDPRFVECRVMAAVGKVVAGEVDDIRKVLAIVHSDRRAEATSIIAAARSDGIRLTQLVRTVERALAELGRF